MNTVKAIAFLLTLGFVAGAHTSEKRRVSKMRQLRHDLETKIDETLDDSFPASDVPNWTPQGMRHIS